MIARRYRHDKDYGMLESWMAARGLPMPPRSWLPKFGIIIDDVTCAFLFKTDCKVSFLEFFFSNPKASNEAKLQAYDLGMVEFEKEAKRRGLESIFAVTSIEKVMGVVLRSGYKGDGKPYYRFRKNLKEQEDVGRSCQPSVEPSAGSSRTHLSTGSAGESGYR